MIQAIGNHFKNGEENKKVFYITSEKFVNDYLNSLTSGTANNFKEKYNQPWSIDYNNKEYVEYDDLLSKIMVKKKI